MAKRHQCLQLQLIDQYIQVMCKKECVHRIYEAYVYACMYVYMCEWKSEYIIECHFQKILKGCCCSKLKTLLSLILITLLYSKSVRRSSLQLIILHAHYSNKLWQIAGL